MSGAAGSLNIKNAENFPDVAGTPFSGSVGVDYQTAFGLVLGTAFTAGFQNQQFSSGTGRFDQNDQAFSLYTAYKAGPVWGNAVASYGLYQDKITREVPLGTFVDTNTANTTGQSLGLALRAGGDMVWGVLTTGPVAGLVLQQVRIKGFTETGLTLVSSFL